MKLSIEIGDYEKGGKLQHWTIVRIVPADSREGISAHDKQGQTEKLARLIDLSQKLETAINEFYSTQTIGVAPRKDAKLDYLGSLLALQEKSPQGQDNHRQ